MLEFVITKTRTAEVVGFLMNIIVAIETQEVNAPKEGSAPFTERKLTDSEHIVKSNTFIKIQTAIVVSVEKFEQV